VCVYTYIHTHTCIFANLSHIYPTISVISIWLLFSINQPFEPYLTANLSNNHKYRNLSHTYLTISITST